jgi:hypothetical protein
VAVAVAVLLAIVISPVGSMRLLQDRLAVATVGRAADGCVIKTTYVPEETSSTPIVSLVCWDPDASLQVLSPERAR